jgi:hypothetical protein
VPLHTGAPHGVPLGASVFPLHVVTVMPSHVGAAHVAPPEHGAREPWGAPWMATQLPGALALSHASHSPAHAALQQTPSTHVPLAHCAALAQAAAFGSGA